MLTFNEKEHKYYYGGKEVPSVSQIMKAITTFFYSNIPQTALDIACSRGTQIHKAIYDYELFDDYEIEDKYKEYFESYLKFKEDYKPEILHQEKMLTNEEFAGTIDYICKIDNEIWLLDWKTSRDLHENLIAVQEAGYDQLCAYSGIKIDKFGAVHLRKDGYELREITPNNEMWDICKRCYDYGRNDNNEN